ncbi:hypothetical protein [Heliorestis acidaminivorans]
MKTYGNMLLPSANPDGLCRSGVKPMRALFGRKFSNLRELREATEGALEVRQKGQSYKVTKEVVLQDEEFRAFASDFFADQDWISPESGGVTPQGEVRCIRVINAKTGTKVLVNSEGYEFPRYTALELT